MKKLIYAFIALIFIFSSCSEDSESSSNEEILMQEGTLVRRMVGQRGSDTETIDFNYSHGNKLKSTITNDGFKNLYTYTKDLITQRKHYEPDGDIIEDTYSYDDQKRMIQRKRILYGETVYRADFVYNSDNTVDVLRYQEFSNEPDQQIAKKKVFLFPNGDVQKIVEYLVVNGENHTKTYMFSYDDKNDATNAILGYNKVKLWDTVEVLGTHNCVTFELFSSVHGGTSLETNYTFTYNSFGYPMTREDDLDEAYSLSVKYFYQ